MMLVSTISYVDRNAIAVLIPTIQRETGMTGREYGLVVAAFSYAYMVGNPIWGILMDRIGVRAGMTLAVAGWSVASAAHGFAGGLLGFSLLRAALGFFEGATFPGSLRTVVQSLGPVERSRGIALSYSGGSLGAIVTPFLVTPIALAYGWRSAFFATGLTGLLWLVWWRRLSRRPAIAVSPSRQEAKPFPWRDRRVVAFIAIYAMGAMPLGFILYMAGLYLANHFRLSQAEIGAVLWIPPLGWECGYFFWGWAMDRMVKSGSTAQEACGRVFAIGLVLSMPLAGAAAISGVPWFLAELFFAMFITGAFIVGGIAYATNAFGSEHAGLLAGLGAGSFSATTALTAPWFGALFDGGQYASAFWIATAFPVVGYALWRVFRAGPESCGDGEARQAQTWR